MKIAKRLMMCGLVAVLTMGVVGCSSEDKPEATATPEASASQEPEASAAPENGAPAELTEEEKAVVIAKIDDTEITQGELDEGYAQYQMNSMMQGMQAASKTEFLDSFIGDKVLFKKAVELIEISDETVEEVYAGLVSQYGEEHVIEVIKEQGYTPETYKEEMIRPNEAVIKLIEQMQAGDTTVTDEEVKKFYEENTANFFTKPAGGEMDHILVKYNEESTDEQKKKAEDAIKEIEKEIADGKTFEDLKTKYSAEEMDKELYVVEELGYIPYNEPNFDPLFLEGAKLVKEGEVSKAVKSSFGTHFIRVQNISEEDTIIPLEQVKPTIVEAITNEKKMNNVQAKLDEYKKDYKIEVFKDLIK